MPVETLRWERFGTFLFLVQRDGPPSDDEWQAFMAQARAFRECTGVVVVEADAKTGPRQRAEIQAFADEFGVRSAIVTDSLVQRGTITAQGWFNVNMKAFGSSEMAGALDFVRLPREAQPDALEVLDEMRQASAVA